MKSYKTTIVMFMLILSMLMATASAEVKLTANDELNDVLEMAESYNYTAYGDIDISKVTIDRVGKKIDATLELNETGSVPTSGAYAYWIILKTSVRSYMIRYDNMEDFDGENISTAVSGVHLYDEDTGEFSDDNYIDDFSFESNILSFTFDLIDSNEICIGLSVITTYTNLVKLYYDEINEEFDFPEITVKDLFNVSVGENKEYTASIDDGDTSDYNWLWVFENISTPKQGKIINQKYLKTGMYSGKLFVYDASTGQYSEKQFEINVTGSSGPSNGGNNQPGFEIVVFISALAIAFILLKKRRK